MDAMVSAAVGRPMLPMALRSCKPGTQFTTRKGGVISYERMMQNLDALVSVHLRVKGVKVRPLGASSGTCQGRPAPRQTMRREVGSDAVRLAPSGTGSQRGGAEEQVARSCVLPVGVTACVAWRMARAGGARPGVATAHGAGPAA